MSVQTVPNSEVASLAAIASSPLPAGAVATWASNGQLAGGSYADYTGIGTPSNPPPGIVRVYTKLDNRLYTLDSNGVEAALGAGGLGITIPLGQHLTFSPDNTYDIGTAAANRPRNAYLAGNVTAGGTLAAPTVDAASVGPSGVSTNLALVAGGGTRWQIQPAGHLLAQSDNAQDIGTTSTNRPRTAYVGTSVVTPSVDAATVGPTSATPLQLRANNTVRWSVASSGNLVPVADNTTDIGTSALRVRNMVLGSYEELTEIVRPSNPAAGAVRIYPKSDHKMYMLDSAGTETDLSALGLTQTQGDARYLQLTGGTLSGALSMSGNLTLSTAAAQIILGGRGAIIRDYGQDGGGTWLVGLNGLTVTPGMSYLAGLTSNGAATINGNAQLFGTVYVGASDTYFSRNASNSILFSGNIGCLALYPTSVNSAALNSCTMAGTSTISDGVIWNGWVRIAGATGLYSNTYGIGIQFTDGVGPRFYNTANAGELFQSRARSDGVSRHVTGGNITIDYTASDGGCFNTGSYCYLPDLNYTWGRTFFVKNMTGAAFNVYASNGNGIYSTGWVNPMTLQHGDSITVFGSQPFSGWVVI